MIVKASLNDVDGEPSSNLRIEPFYAIYQT